MSTAEEAEALALFREGVEPCPGCAQQITFKKSVDDLSVEVLHPVPPCPGFRAFCERLIERNHAAPINPRKLRLKQQREQRVKGYRTHVCQETGVLDYSYCKAPMRPAEYRFSSAELRSFEADPLACKNCLRELRHERKRQPTLPAVIEFIRVAVRI